MKVVGGPGRGDAEFELDCVDVRDRLTEYALSLLPASEVEPVERHLAWCAGCRKEGAELTGGAAAIGLSARAAEPPAGLDDKVVHRIRAAAGTARRSRRKGRARTRTTVILAAALALVMGLGWATTVARLQSAEKARNASQHQMSDVAEKFSKLTKELLRGHEPRSGDRARSFQLFPRGRQGGGGWAMVYTSPSQRDWVLVVVGGLDPASFPYHVSLQSSDGEALSAGVLKPDSPGGGGYLFHRYARSLAKVNRLVVTDLHGHVMEGLGDRLVSRPGAI